MKLPNNFCVDTDAYKITHHLLDRDDLTGRISYGECRIGAKYPDTLLFGPQMICIEHFEGQVIDKYKIDEAQYLSAEWFGTDKYFNRAMFDYILNQYGGMLPVEIKAVREGSRVPISNVLFTLEALDRKCLPLVQHMETLFMQFWYPTTIATDCFYIRQDIKGFLEKTGTPELLPYMLHNFGYRATSCQEQSAIGGVAHMISFEGSDTLVSDRAIQFYYGYDKLTRLKSVLATEHSVALQYGPGEGEYEYVKAALKATPDHLIASIVIDTYDAENFIDNVVTRPDIMEMVKARSGKTVWRQDSGEAKQCTLRNLDSLSRSYGMDFNSKGYKVLHPKIGLLQGDHIERATCKELYEYIISYKWSADNVVMGSGGGIMVKNFERDTQRIAIKPSLIRLDGIDKPVQKTVKSQPDKASKPGHLKLHRSGNTFHTFSSVTTPEAEFKGYVDSLEVIFRNGELKRRQTFNDVINIARSYEY